MTLLRAAGTVFACLFLCAAGWPARAESTPDMEKLAWIAGSWKGSLGENTIEEHWTEPAGGLMLAVARVVSAERTVMFEYLRIESREDGIYYVAQPNGRPGTDFKLTKVSKTEAVFENPKHDFPKLIRYKLENDGTLVASTEGGGTGQQKGQQFRFTRVR